MAVLNKEMVTSAVIKIPKWHLMEQIQYTYIFANSEDRKVVEFWCCSKMILYFQKFLTRLET